MPPGTQRCRPCPIHALAYLLLCLFLKIYQLRLIACEHELTRSFYGHLPWTFWQDAVAAFLILAVWDAGLGHPGLRSSGRTGRGLTLLGRIFFNLLIIYQFIMFKFYYLFETFLSYGLYLQADRLGSYASGILHEVDLAVAGLLLAGAFYANATWILAGRVSGQAQRSQPQTPEEQARLARKGHPHWPRAFGWTAGVLLVYLAAGAAAGRFMDAKTNYYSLDKNPLFEILSTAMQARPGLSGPDRGPQLPGPDFSAASLVRPKTWSKRIVLNNLSRRQRQDLNVAFILLESLPPQYTGLREAKWKTLTPNLCRLAESSLVFSQHYCQEPASLKSLYSILTGNYSYQTRDWKAFVARAQGDRSLPDMLRRHGYVTAFFTSADGRVYSQNDFLGPRFDRVVDLNAMTKRAYPWARDRSSYDDSVLPALLEEFLQSDPGKFVVFLNPYFPHHPYPAPPEAFRVNREDSAFAHYQNSMFYADHILGRILALLKQKRLLDKTLVVVASDHGEAFYQHPGNYLHSIHLYEENVATLFLMSHPRLFRPGVFKFPSQHVDITPTILDALGYPADGFDGISLLKPHPSRGAFFYTTFSDQRFGLRDGAFKYIADMDYDSEELYNLEMDREELKDIAASRPDMCRKFKARLLELREKIQ